jgi:hypothetical protein
MYWADETMMNHYRAIDVWKRLDGTSAVRYRCLECLQSKRFCVQSADVYRLPLDGKLASFVDSQFVELFIEQEPSSRSREYSTLEEAIAAHEESFL